MCHDRRMPKRVKQKRTAKRGTGDANQIAHQLVDLSTRRLYNGTPENAPIPKSVSQYMAEIGRRGGPVGGTQRLNTRSAEARQQEAQQAARARVGERKHIE